MCKVAGTATPCSAYRDEDACPVEVCHWLFSSCDEVTTTTQSTTTTSTTTLPDPCDVATCVTSCISDREKGTYSCSPCPPGFVGNPEVRCEAVSCPDLIPGLESTVLQGGGFGRCFFTSYNDTCATRCKTGFRAVNAQEFRCTEKGWEGSIICEDIQVGVQCICTWRGFHSAGSGPHFGTASGGKQGGEKGMKGTKSRCCACQVLLHYNSVKTSLVFVGLHRNVRSSSLVTAV